MHKVIAATIFALLAADAAGAECLKESLEHYESRANVTGPLDLKKLSKFENDSVRGFIDNALVDDAIYHVEFYSDPSSPNYWGYTSLTIVRNRCVITEIFTSHDN